MWFGFPHFFFLKKKILHPPMNKKGSSHREDASTTQWFASLEYVLGFLCLRFGTVSPQHDETC
jgi:hypothetical protein